MNYNIIFKTAQEVIDSREVVESGDDTMVMYSYSPIFVYLSRDLTEDEAGSIAHCLYTFSSHPNGALWPLAHLISSLEQQRPEGVPLN